MAINKVVLGTETLIDLTSDTVTADRLFEGFVAHDASGASIVGTLHDGDLLAYGLGTSPYVNVAKVGSAVVVDNDTNITGQALTELAVLSE